MPSFITVATVRAEYRAELESAMPDMPVDVELAFVGYDDDADPWIDLGEPIA